MEAQITLEYDDARMAEAVARSVSPDNLKTPEGLSVKTTTEDKKVITKIKSRRKMSTFIATIDDLLSCASTAEKTIRTARLLG